MAASPISTSHIDYLQRIGITPGAISASTTMTSASPGLRRLWQIHEVGRSEKQSIPRQEQKVHLPSEDVITGLFGSNVNLAFIVRGTPSSVAIHLGAWLPANQSGQDIDQHFDIVKSTLNSLYPATRMSETMADISGFPLGGIALGIPTAKHPETSDGAQALDRLIRAMSGVNWACMILAMPVGEGFTSKLRQDVIEEMRTVHIAGQTGAAPKPLLDHYNDLLKNLLLSYTSGLSTGMWRTGVYLLGDRQSYDRLASLWRGIFSGDDSLPESIVVWNLAHAPSLASSWSLPDLSGHVSPGHYQHPLGYQTFLTSRQLATYVHLPELETSGFAINMLPSFDSVPRTVNDQSAINLGSVVLRAQVIDQPYAIHRDDLTRHVFIAGVTGAGKTNTIFQLIQKTVQKDTPFLVIEPAKTEYRALLNDPGLAQRLQVFTLGDERVSPFRLNPFEVLPGVPVGVHLDLLRSVFSVSFGMWTPLPQVLEQCLYAIYADRGWDITRDSNHRLDPASDRSIAFPTLSDLAVKVEEVTASLGYEERIASDVRAALLTRINGLRTGGKGRMLDVRRSLPMSTLLERPTVLELEGMGDDDDKAFMMGLLLIRLVEYRRVAGQTQGLQHLLIIEEAHRLLTNVGLQTNQEEANPRGKAVETFANLLSEVRAYGQGIIIADQVPAKLAPDVIKNTNLKIAHRIVAADDRQALAGAMAMNEKQAQALAILPNGQAAVFSEGDDAPVLIRVDKDELKSHATGDDQVSERMHSLRRDKNFDRLFVPLPGCVETCASNEPACTQSSRLVEDITFQRAFALLVQSIMEDPDALDRLWPDLLTIIHAQRPEYIDEMALQRSLATHAADWFAQRRGAQAGWSYTATEMFATLLRHLLLDKIAKVKSTASGIEFQEFAWKLYARREDPFLACSRICRQQPPLCLYRYAAAELTAGGRFQAAWQAAETEPDDNYLQSLLDVCSDASSELIEFADDGWPEAQIEAVNQAARRAGLCFGQQMILQDETKSFTDRKQILSKLLQEASHEQ